MWTDSKLIKSLMFSVLFGAAGTVVAAIPTSPETMVVQQGNKVSGLVSDDMGPVAGASVVVKGTSVGTITDTDGRFSLDNVRRGSVIVISFVGLATQEITWNGQANLNVKLSDATQDLDEVVVVAYGTAKKSTFTGSASVVKAEKLEKVMGTGFTEALQGMSAGVNVVNVQGNPGAEPVSKFVVFLLCPERLILCILWTVCLTMAVLIRSIRRISNR